MYNKVIMMGRICSDPELKTTPNGTNVCSFRIAVDRRFQQSGEETRRIFSTWWHGAPPESLSVSISARVA